MSNENSKFRRHKPGVSEMAGSTKINRLGKGGRVKKQKEKGSREESGHVQKKEKTN